MAAQPGGQAAHLVAQAAPLLLRQQLKGTVHQLIHRGVPLLVLLDRLLTDRLAGELLQLLLQGLHVLGDPLLELLDRLRVHPLLGQQFPEQLQQLLELLPVQ